jgi:hypothetical protein
MFEDAVRRAPSETKKAVFLRYKKFEEFGLAGRAMKVHEDAANASFLQPRQDRRFYILTTCTSNGSRRCSAFAIHSGGLPDKFESLSASGSLTWRLLALGNSSAPGLHSSGRSIGTLLKTYF